MKHQFKDFDESVNEVLWEETAFFGSFEMVVGVYRYNGGIPKVGITKRVGGRDGETKYAKMGRMSLDVAEAVTNLMLKAIDYMKKNSLDDAHQGENTKEVLNK